MIVELARRVSSCGWVALCERRRAGFARLSGWQPRIFQHPSTTSRESRRTVCVGKWPKAERSRDPAYHTGRQKVCGFVGQVKAHVDFQISTHYEDPASR